MSDETWYAIVDGAGQLISVGTVVAAPDVLAEKGYTAKALPGNPAGQIWDVATQAFVSPPPAPSPGISTWQYIGRFTPSEYAAVESSQDPMVRQFLTMTMTTALIHMDEPIVRQGIAYLISQNLITADRAAVIGAA